MQDIIDYLKKNKDNAFTKEQIGYILGMNTRVVHNRLINMRSHKEYSQHLGVYYERVERFGYSVKLAFYYHK